MIVKRDDGQRTSAFGCLVFPNLNLSSILQVGAFFWSYCACLGLLSQY